MTDEEVRQIAVDMGKIFNDGDDEVAKRLVHPDFIDYEAPEGSPRGPEAYANTARWMRSVWEGARWEIVDSFAKGDKATLRVIFTGRQVTDFMGVPATGKSVRVQHIHIYRVTDGQVHEHWAVRDDLELFRQLGAWDKPLMGAPKPAPTA
ncbi:ester cyclase [Allostreptomyces psammosilenae]|uniref:Putative ester cyclase n=1 Tax=Allostreptomyces psammosilenae TaxID=1892865 RepID=A0A852ZTF3_9ACTN|nr:ester cyclase [Allostreptomyces psammosilenae]NYI04064.1 putative ester cyclase [Allostreptomyces psammosilenae]